jgi:hypothetical protein
MIGRDPGLGEPAADELPVLNVELEPGAQPRDGHHRRGCLRAQNPAHDP